MSLKETIKLVFGWRLIILLIAIPAIFLLAPRTRFTNLTEKPSVSNIFSMWSNFDGLHYLDLATYGYGYQHKTDMDYAFFPLYPWATRTFNFFGSYLASGLIISHVFLVLALYFLYKLINIDHKPKVAKATVLLMLLFPASFFFGSVYTESLFLLLVVLSFYFSRKGNFLLACFFASLASATRITGIFLLPALAYEFWLLHGKSIKKCLNLSALYLLLAPVGLLSFIKFQAVKTGDPLFFINIQSNFAGRTTEKLILVHQVLYRYAKMLIFVDHTDPLFFTVVFELFSALLIMFVLIFGLKKIRFSYWIFTFLSFLLPTFTGTFMSMPRFVLGLFPVFVFIALWLEKQHPFVRMAYYSICAIFTVLAVMLFTRGYFVA